MILNKTIGSMLIIAGTSIGAGMLALPIASAGLGFSTAMIVLLIMWLLMTYTALLMLEVHQYASAEATLNTLAKSLLGKKGQLIANLSMLFLFYALCSAYIAGGGAQLQDNIKSILNVQVAPQIGPIVFAVVIGAIITLGTATVDKVNRVLFTIKIFVLISIFYLLTPSIQGENLLAMPMQQGLIISALPIIFTAFGFHGSIPSVVRYIGIDIKSLRKVMIIGATLPLFIYLLWQTVSQGVINQEALEGVGGLNEFISILSIKLNSPSIRSSITIFADLALATSFLGVSLGLFDFLRDSLNRGSSKQDRLVTAAVTFLPPLGFALFYPQGFISALGYAAIALVVLAVFLPVAMVWVQRKQKEANSNDYQVCGGIPALVLATTCGVTIIAAQLMQAIGIIPTIG
ncbi:tyrosine transporter TyrP [Psychromonas sp. MB-3u-54]|uniref:aromatic amino acid transport family protein n=1 Tax=Psychromonas sp. MB-3u-54 TaxID=2058319 RepID=UPI000C34DEB0|nr:aromatic amino acid transport family protein [Psychromonas sp. MB-3u-54]PKH01942.1 tyrosine transporter TyrP [Psychromonas sp. MB-3u-54]